MFEKAIEIEPQHTASLYHLGLMYHKNRNYKDALLAYSKVLSLVQAKSNEEDALVFILNFGL